MSLLKASKYKDPEYMKKYYRKNKDKMIQQSISNTARRTSDDREYIKEVTNLACIECGFTHNTTAPFDFHHLDPSLKEKAIGEMIGRATRDRLEEEISKCVFLCKNCHAIEHERIRRETHVPS